MGLRDLNCETAQKHLVMIWPDSLFLLLLASYSYGEEIKVPSWEMGMKPFSKCVSPGDKVTFTWDPEGSHNVEKVTKAQFSSCSKFEATDVDSSGSFTWTAPAKPDVYYFVCSVGDHCKEGSMKAEIKVAKKLLEKKRKR